MADTPVTTYVVSVVEKPHWRTAYHQGQDQSAGDGEGDRRQGADRGDHPEGEEALASAGLGYGGSSLVSRR